MQPSTFSTHGKETKKGCCEEGSTGSPQAPLDEEGSCAEETGTPPHRPQGSCAEEGSTPPPALSHGSPLMKTPASARGFSFAGHLTYSYICSFV